MAIQIVLEMHSQSEDNVRGHASGWADPPLTEEGRAQAVEMGLRRRDDGISACFTSDLRRAAECAALCFSGSEVPVLHDWRLRETDYGDRNAAPAATVHSGLAGFDDPYPGGESWAQAVERVGRFLQDLPLRWSEQRVCVVGHIATLWGFHHHINHRRLEDLFANPDPYAPGVEFVLG